MRISFQSSAGSRALIQPRESSTQSPTARPHFRLITLAGGLTAILSFAGCAIPTVLPPEARGQFAQTHARCHVPQPALNVQYMQSSYGGGGLIGAIVDASVNGVMAASAEHRAQRIRAAAADYDFRKEYWECLSNAVSEIEWVKMNGFEPSPMAVQPPAKELLAEFGFMNMGGSYAISPDCRVFEVRTGMDMYIPHKHGRPAASNLVCYYSSEIGIEEGDKAADLWAQNSADVYRRAAAEAIVETAKLVHYALELMGGAELPAQPAVLRAKLVHGRGEFGIPVGKVGMKGRILEQTSDRAIFQDAIGHLYSFPAREIEIQMLPQPNRS